MHNFAWLFHTLVKDILVTASMLRHGINKNLQKVHVFIVHVPKKKTNRAFSWPIEKKNFHKNKKSFLRRPMNSKRM